QQAVLKAVVEEDVRVRRGNDGAKAVLVQRPRRMLATRTATEVLAREQNRGALIARLVQGELRVQGTLGVVHARLAVIQVAQFVEQIGTEPGTLDRLEELL